MTLINTIAVAPGEEPIHIVMTADEESAFLSAQDAAQAIAAIADLKEEAARLLIKSDITVLRCMENQISVPKTWVDYRATLRLIAKTGSGEIPVQPAYPDGT